MIASRATKSARASGDRPSPIADRRSCGRCRWLLADRSAIERALPGILALGSAFGDSWARQGLCRAHDCMVDRTLCCPRFECHAPADEA